MKLCKFYQYFDQTSVWGNIWKLQIYDQIRAIIIMNDDTPLYNAWSETSEC